MNLVFERHMKGSGAVEEISYERALGIGLASYRDCDMVRDMLTTGNRIACQYSDICVYEVMPDGKRMTSMAGLWNLTPPDAEYDDDGNRLN